MKLLLDTHAFLWFFIGNPSLSAKARASIEDESIQHSMTMLLLDCGR
jgi:PIN domain nuclease of toxin-antitoxin system